MEFAAEGASDSEPPDTIASWADVSFNEWMAWAPLILIAPETDWLIVTSSELPGTWPDDQFIMSAQLRVPAPPFQDTGAGTSRLSSCSTKSRTRGRAAFFSERVRFWD
jgi:hypothetical protein